MGKNMFSSDQAHWLGMCAYLFKSVQYFRNVEGVPPRVYWRNLDLSVVALLKGTQPCTSLTEVMVMWTGMPYSHLEHESRKGQTGRGNLGTDLSAKPCVQEGSLLRNLSCSASMVPLWEETEQGELGFDPWHTVCGERVCIILYIRIFSQSNCFDHVVFYHTPALDFLYALGRMKQSAIP